MKAGAFAIALSGTILYHVAQRSTPQTVNPFLSLIVTYLVALAACVIAFVSTAQTRDHSTWAPVNWASLTCGLAIFAAELGYLLAYRSGWNLKTLALASNVLVAVILLPIGLLFFQEKVSMQTGVGIALCISGLMLMVR